MHRVQPIEAMYTFIVDADVDAVFAKKTGCSPQHKNRKKGEETIDDPLPKC